MSKKFLSRSFVLASVAATLLAPTANAKTLVYCSEGSPSTFNPQIAVDGTSINASAHTVYNRLLEFEYGTTKVQPSLAESYKVSADNLTYTFKLRKGVKFHSNKDFKPSRDLNSDDVVWTFERMLKKDHPYNSIGGGTYEYWDGMEMGKLIKSIKAIDPLTVEIVLNAPEAPFTANLAMPFMSVLSKEYGEFLAAKNKKNEIDTNPIGTGAFVFQSYQKDSTIRFTANEQYWGKHGNIDKLVFAITPDSNVRTQKLKAGECQFVTEPSPADLKDLKANAKLNVISSAGLNVGYLAMNTTKKPFDSLLVRKAVNHALNRKAYIDAIYMGNATVAKNPIPPTIWSYNESTRDFEYSPEKAKELLKQAGLEGGFETEMWTMPVSRPYNPNGKKLGEMMQADLAKVGIKVKLVSFDWPTYLAKAKKGEHVMIQFGWTGDNGDPDNFLNVLLGCASIAAGSNYSQWCNKKFDDLVTSAKRTTELKKRIEAYRKAQLVFKEDAPWVTLAHTTVFRAMDKKLTGYKMDPLGGDIFINVNLE